MIQKIISISILAVFVISLTPLASAQFQSGGVNKEGTWYVGEGLKKGDFFSYSLCHVDYKECAKFRMDIWIEGDTVVGTENPWLAKVVVYDGNKIVTGEMTLGKVAPEPTGGTLELASYRGAFKTSVVWLSAFATSYGGDGGEGPKSFKAPSWGKIGNIGGEQVVPFAIETIGTQAGTFEDSVRISWKTGGYRSNVWIVDNFPFPVKARTVTHVSEGIPPPEYVFELLDYKENVKENPFKGIVSSSIAQKAKGCPEKYQLVDVKKPTKEFKYQINAKYGPSEPKVGCEIEWFISFLSKYDDTEFLNQVQYDILVVDDGLTPIRSQAQDEGRLFLYSPSGQVRLMTLVEDSPGIAKYVIWIYGLSHETITPPPQQLDYLIIDIPIKKADTSPIITKELNIPSWIKSNAGWWATDQIDDISFVGGIKYLIDEKVIVIPPTQQGTGSENNEIPNWIKTNAGWWADNLISDNDFVQGIQWLIQNGIIVLASV